MASGKLQSEETTGNPSLIHVFVVNISLQVKIKAELALLLIKLFLGKPNHVATHPDYVPSKFPDIYRKVKVKDHENLSRMNRRINRVTKTTQQADVGVSKQLNKQLLLERRAKFQEERQRKRLEKEEKCKEDEKKHKEEKERENLEFCKRQEYVEKVIAERKQQESEKRKQQEDTRREEIRKRNMEKRIIKKKRRIGT